MKPPNVERAKSRVIVDRGAILNRISAFITTLSGWWRSRLPGNPGLVFSAVELDAIAFSTALGQTDQDIAAELLAG